MALHAETEYRVVLLSEYNDVLDGNVFDDKTEARNFAEKLWYEDGSGRRSVELEEVTIYRNTKGGREIRRRERTIWRNGSVA